MASNSHHSLPAASNATLSLPTSSNTNLQLRNISTSTTMSSYLDVFLPSQLTSPSHVIPKCICNALFLVLLISAGEDLLEKDNSSSPPSLWVFLFIPLFASNFMEAAHCTYQLRQLLYFNTENTENKTDVEDVECIESGITTGNRTRSRSSSSGSSGGSIHGRRSRSSSFVEMTAAGELQEIGSREQLSAAAGNTANNHSTSTSMLVIGLIDQFGFAYAKCVLLYYLITNTTGTITESLLPYFLCVLTSIALRGLQIKQLQLQRSAEHIPFLTPPQLWSDILVTSVFFALRGMQIFLIALHIDRFIQVSWMLIFMPSWICVFGAFASALLLLSYTPMMYSNLTYASALKLNCHRLSFGLAIYLAVYAMTGFSTLLFLSERLAFEYDQPGFSSSNSNGVNHSITKILIPLIILMVFIAVTNPLLYNLTIKYKVRNILSS